MNKITMKPRRLASYFFIVGAFYEIILIVLWRLYQPYEIIGLLFTYNSVSIFIADTITQFIWPNYFAPPTSMILLFDVILVIAFATQCAVLGYIIQKFATKLRSKTVPEQLCLNDTSEKHIQ